MNCIFCKDNKAFVEAVHRPKKTTGYFVRCDNCDSSGPTKDSEKDAEYFYYEATKPSKVSDFLGEALNSGDSTYKP